MSKHRPNPLIAPTILFAVLSQFIICSQSCEAPSSNLQCSEISYSIYIDQYNQNELNDIVSPILQLLQHEPIECQLALRPLICSMFFQPCMHKSDNSSEIVGQRVCKSSCESILQSTSTCKYAASYLSQIRCDNSTFFYQDDTESFNSPQCNDMQNFATAPNVAYLGQCSDSPPQGCEHFQDKSGNLIYEVHSSVYLPYSLTIEMLEETIYLMNNPLNLVMGLPGGEQCVNDLYRLSCTSVMRRCEMIEYLYSFDETYFGNLTTVVSLAIPELSPCQSVCEAVLASCGGIPFLSFNGIAFNCTQIEPITGFPLYLPDMGQTQILPGVDMTCWTSQQLASETIVTPLECVEPLLYVATADPPCQIPCRTFLYDEQDTRTIEQIFYTISHISLVLDLVVVFTWIAFKKKRRFPMNLSLHLSVSSTMISSVLVIGSWIGLDDVFCKSDTVRMQTEGFCGFQAFIILLFGLSTVFWWLVLIIVLFTSVVYDVGQLAYYQKYFHLACWGIPFITASTATLMGSTGYDGFSSLCIFRPSTSIETQFAVFYGWIGVSIALGCALVTALVVHTIRASRAVRGTIRFMRPHFRLFLLCILVMIVFSVIFGFRISIKAMENEIEKSVVENLICRGLDSSADCPGYHLPPTALWAMSSISPGIQGTFVFLLFGLTKENYELWSRLFLSRRKGLLGRFNTWASSNSPSDIEMPNRSASSLESPSPKSPPLELDFASE